MRIDKGFVRDFIIVEVASLAVIAFAYFVWPYWPFVWEYDYSVWTTANFLTVSMAVIAWVGVGYFIVLIFQGIFNLLKRFIPARHTAGNEPI